MTKTTAARKSRNPQDEAARAAGLLRVAAREIAEAGTSAVIPYRKRIRLLATLADALSKQIYEDIADYDESHKRKR